MASGNNILSILTVQELFFFKTAEISRAALVRKVKHKETVRLLTEINNLLPMKLNQVIS
jgi:hypothetical protein